MGSWKVYLDSRFEELEEGSRIKKDYPEIFNRDRIGRAKDTDKYVGDDYFIRFSETWMDSQGQNVNKVGVNTKRAWGNPRGVYAYFMDDYKKGINASYATNSDAAFVIKKIPYGKQIDDIGNLSNKDYVELTNKLSDYLINSEKFPDIKTKDEFNRYMKETERDSDNKTLGGVLFYSVITLGEEMDGAKNPDVAMAYLWRTVMGVTFIGDKGKGIIHPNEPSQVLFLDRKAYEVVSELKNKKDSSSRRTLPFSNWIYNDDGLVIVNGGVRIIPEYIKNGKLIWNFYHVKGSFICKSQKDLESMEGFPKVISDKLDCSGCTKLRNLDYLPRFANSMIFSYCDSLQSLEGLEDKTRCDTFVFSYCGGLKNLKGFPSNARSFDCSYCENLESLEGLVDSTALRHLIVRGCPKITESDIMNLDVSLRKKIMYKIEENVVYRNDILARLSSLVEAPIIYDDETENKRKTIGKDGTEWSDAPPVNASVKELEEWVNDAVKRNILKVSNAGVGTTRKAKYNDGKTVFKWVYNDKLNAQMEQEFRVYDEFYKSFKDVVPKIYKRGKHWVIMENVIPVYMIKNDFKKYVGYDFNVLDKAARFLSEDYKQRKWKDGKRNFDDYISSVKQLMDSLGMEYEWAYIEEALGSELVYRMMKFLYESGVGYADLHNANVGFSSDNKLKVLDYGQ